MLRRKLDNKFRKPDTEPRVSFVATALRVSDFLLVSEDDICVRRREPVPRGPRTGCIIFLDAEELEELSLESGIDEVESDVEAALSVCREHGAVDAVRQHGGSQLVEFRSEAEAARAQATLALTNFSSVAKHLSSLPYLPFEGQRIMFTPEFLAAQAPQSIPFDLLSLVYEYAVDMVELSGNWEVEDGPVHWVTHTSRASVCIGHTGRTEKKWNYGFLAYSTDTVDPRKPRIFIYRLVGVVDLEAGTIRWDNDTIWKKID